MWHIIRFIIFMLARHVRESTRVHHKDSLTYKFLSLFSNKYWDKIKSWWTENRWETKSWWIKNVFTFANDGWKFWSWIMVYTVCYEFAVGITMVYNIPTSWSWFGLTWVYALILLMITGLYHSLIDGSLINKK